MYDYTSFRFKDQPSWLSLSLLSCCQRSVSLCKTIPHPFPTTLPQTWFVPYWVFLITLCPLERLKICKILPNLVSQDPDMGIPGTKHPPDLSQTLFQPLFLNLVLTIGCDLSPFLVRFGSFLNIILASNLHGRTWKWDQMAVLGPGFHSEVSLGPLGWVHTFAIILTCFVTTFYTKNKRSVTKKVALFGYADFDHVPSHFLGPPWSILQLRG